MTDTNTNTNSGIGDAARKTHAAVTNTANLLGEKIKQNCPEIVNQCNKLEDAGHAAVVNHPGKSLAIAALTGVAIGFLLSFRSASTATAK